MSSPDTPQSTSTGLSRRNLLAIGGLGTAAAIVGGGAAADPAPATAVPPQFDNPFRLGVASGDPAPDGVVLWTRLAPDPLNGGGMPPHPIAVQWQIATDEGMH